MRDRFRRTANNLWNYIAMLRDEGRYWDQMIGAFMAGAPQVADPRTIARNARILAIVQDFDNPQRDRLEYLRAIAHNF